jgi:hypothetical protein
MNVMRGGIVITMRASRHPHIYAVIGVQQADPFMMDVFHQQHDLTTFSVVGEGN